VFKEGNKEDQSMRARKTMDIGAFEPQSTKAKTTEDNSPMHMQLGTTVAMTKQLRLGTRIPGNEAQAREHRLSYATALTC
jgi:hypothetical protein